MELAHLHEAIRGIGNKEACCPPIGGIFLNRLKADKAKAWPKPVSGLGGREETSEIYD